MNRLEELLLKWHDQSISPVELQELNQALKDPACRKQFRQSFGLDGQMVEAFQSAQALAQTSAEAKKFQTIEVRAAHVLESAYATQVKRFTALWDKLENLISSRGTATPRARWIARLS